MPSRRAYAAKEPCVPGRAPLRALLLCLATCCGGCHSAFVQATVENRTGAVVHLLEVDYPNASFGTQELPSGANFKYRLKILGDGPTKLTWTDSQQKEHTSSGPALSEGQEGSLTIRLQGDKTATWSPVLVRR